MLNKLHYLTKFISSTMLHSECYWTISQNISFRIQTCRRRIIISRHMIHKIQYDYIILFHVTFFVDYHSKYFLFGQKFYSLCMRACMCARGRTSVCVCEISDCHQLWLLVPAAIFCPCHWWQSVLWVSVSLMWRLKQHFDISQNRTCSRNFSFAVTHTTVFFDR